MWLPSKLLIYKYIFDVSYDAMFVSKLILGNTNVYSQVNRVFFYNDQLFAFERPDNGRITDLEYRTHVLLSIELWSVSISWYVTFIIPSSDSALLGTELMKLHRYNEIILPWYIYGVISLKKQGADYLKTYILNAYLPLNFPTILVDWFRETR